MPHIYHDLPPDLHRRLFNSITHTHTHRFAMSRHCRTSQNIKEKIVHVISNHLSDEKLPRIKTYW